MKNDWDDYKSYYKSCYRYMRSAEEQNALLREYKRSGDMAARDAFLSAQLCWLASTVRSVFGLCPMILDLVQEGAFCLTKILEKYDVDNLSHASFRTYARVIVLRHLTKKLDGMKDGMAVKINVRRQSTFVRMAFRSLIADGMSEWEALEETTKRFYQKFSKRDYPSMPPYKKEKAQDKVRNLLALGNVSASLDKPVNAEEPDGETFGDSVSDDDANPEDIVADEETLRLIYEAIESDLLSDRERYILEHYVGLGDADRMTITEIAYQVGVSRQRVSAILVEIRGKLRKALGLEVA